MSDSTDPKPVGSMSESVARRRYVRPRLVRFGGLADITAALAIPGEKNDMLGGNFKT